MRETWDVDGWVLTDGVDRDVEYRAGLYVSPGAEGEDGNVSNRSGRIWRPKTHGPGTFTLAMWFGSDISRHTVETYYDLLLRAVVHPHRLSTYTRGLADGSKRSCLGDVVAQLTPTPIGQRGMRCGIQVNVPGAFWKGDTDKSQSVNMPATAASGSVTLTLSSFGDSTAPMEDLTYAITGPASDPKVEDFTGGVAGEYLQYIGTIPAGQTYTFSAKDWTVVSSGASVPNLAAVNHNGRRFLVVPPARPSQVPAVRFTANTVTSATRLAVSGREAFLL